MKEKASIGVIIGNRDFFPDKLVSEARQDILAQFDKLGLKAILLDESDSKLGGVETFSDARKCAALFSKHADEITGILVADPDPTDPTTGSVPQPERPTHRRMPTRMPGAGEQR